MSDGLTDDELALAHQIFEMARDGRTEELAPYLEAGLTPNLTNSKGDTLLTLAAYHAHPGTVELLLAHGADVSRVNDRGQTALAAAVFRSAERIVRALLAAGADPDAGSPSAVAVAQFFELPAMAAVLAEHPPRDGAGA